MNKSDLIAALAKETDLPRRKSGKIVNLFFDTIAKTLFQGDRIEIRGFGSLMVKQYKGYVGRNPKAGKKIEVDEKHPPCFRTGKDSENISKT